MASRVDPIRLKLPERLGRTAVGAPHETITTTVVALEAPERAVSLNPRPTHVELAPTLSTREHVGVLHDLDLLHLGMRTVNTHVTNHTRAQAPSRSVTRCGTTPKTACHQPAQRLSRQDQPCEQQGPTHTHPPPRRRPHIPIRRPNHATPTQTHQNHRRRTRSTVPTMRLTPRLAHAQASKRRHLSPVERHRNHPHRPDPGRRGRTVDRPRPRLTP